MDLRKYQDAVLHGSLCVNERDRFIENTLGLAGEAGEFADQVKKQIRDGESRVMRQVEELGDVLWYLTSLAGQLGYTLAELASINYNKLSERHPDRYPRVVE
jgi:NTP pyrophosphatase (non-canonical NTP hydrolase)